MFFMSLSLKFLTGSIFMLSKCLKSRPGKFIYRLQSNIRSLFCLQKEFCCKRTSAKSKVEKCELSNSSHPPLRAFTYNIGKLSSEPTRQLVYRTSMASVKVLEVKKKSALGPRGEEPGRGGNART